MLRRSKALASLIQAIVNFFSDRMAARQIIRIHLLLEFIIGLIGLKQRLGCELGDQGKGG